MRGRLGHVSVGVRILLKQILNNFFVAVQIALNSEECRVLGCCEDGN